MKLNSFNKRMNEFIQKFGILEIYNEINKLSDLEISSFFI